MLLEIEGQNIAWSFADTLQGDLLKEVVARGLPLLLARRGKRREPGAREGRDWTPMCGRGSEEISIELASGRFLLDDGETGDAVERIGLHSEPGIGDLVTAAGTDPVRTCMQGCERLLDPAKLSDGE